MGATHNPGLEQKENGQDQLKHEQSTTRSLTLCAWQSYHAYVPRSRVTCRNVRRMGWMCWPVFSRPDKLSRVVIWFGHPREIELLAA